MKFKPQWFVQKLAQTASKFARRCKNFWVHNVQLGWIREGVQGRHEPREMVSKPLDSQMSI